MKPEIEFILNGELNALPLRAPFDRMTPPRLGQLLEGASIVFHRQGSQIFHPDIAQRVHSFWIVRQGQVRQVARHPLGLGSYNDQQLLTGSIFPVDRILDDRADSDSYFADTDCYLWQIEEAAIADWLTEPGFLRWLAEQLQQQNLAIRQSASELERSRQLADQALALPAKSIGSPNVTCVPATQPFAEVAQTMREQRIGSVLVGTTDRIEGIVTATDLIQRGIAQQLPYATPIAQLMTARPAAVDDSISVFGAAVEMAQGKYRHLPLKDSEGKVSTIVSERDLFRAQHQGVSHVFKSIDDAGSVDELIELARKASQLGERVFRQGMEVSQFLRLTSSINDRIAKRLLELLLACYPALPAFCWLAFGSEGREEQGFVTDQDNGIVFEAAPDSDPEASRQIFLALAREMNDALHACGFERCKGNIMASNPEWCLSLVEWKNKFSSWVRATTPTAILNSTIFFDFRPVFGATCLAEEMRDHLQDILKGNSIFIHLLAINALTVAPPLGRLGGFATEAGKIDLKTQGTRLFVDIARIYALANGVKAVNTEQRLALVGQRIKRSVNAIQGDIAAFQHLQNLRLKRQATSLRDGGDANRLDPKTLDELQQRILRECLKQAAALQERLKLDYKR